MDAGGLEGFGKLLVSMDFGDTGVGPEGDFPPTGGLGLIPLP